MARSAVYDGVRMTMNKHPASYWFVPLLKPRESLVSPVQICAIDTVRLRAGDSPAQVLQQFYTGVLGLLPVAAGEDRLVYRLGLIRAELLRQAESFSALAITADTQPFQYHARRRLPAAKRQQPARPRVIGQIGLIIRNFSQAVEKIGPHCEILHGDTGLCRSALLQDPAGNCIYLLETRPF